MAFNFPGLLGVSPYNNFVVRGPHIIPHQHQQHHQIQQRQQHQQHQHRQPHHHQHHGHHGHGHGHGHGQAPLEPMIPWDIIDDLCIRFTLHLPPEESEVPRVIFQIENAHWFFIDNYCVEGCDPSFTAMSQIKFIDFAALVFERTPNLRHQVKDLGAIIQEWKEYKQMVPTFGAILMDENMTQVLLVQGYSNQWGFPKGKINKDEIAVTCAIREVYEETSYDISQMVNPSYFIENVNDNRKARLYIVTGTDVNFEFHPQMNLEIKKTQWFSLEDLPESKNDDPEKVKKYHSRVQQFYAVYPFVKRLKRWVEDKLTGKYSIDNFRAQGFTIPQKQDDNNLTISQLNQGKKSPMKPCNNKSNQRGRSTENKPKQSLGSQKAQEQNKNIVKTKQPRSSQQQVNFEASSSLASMLGIPVIGASANPPSKSSAKSTKSKQQVPATATTNPSAPTSTKPPGSAPLKGKEITEQVVSTSKSSSKDFTINDLTCPSWTNFKFDMDKILEAWKSFS